MSATLGRPVEPWVFHDLRRSTATGLQRLGVRLEVTECILGDSGGSRAGVVGVYQRHEYLDESSGPRWRLGRPRFARLRAARRRPRTWSDSGRADPDLGFRFVAARPLALKQQGWGMCPASGFSPLFLYSFSSVGGAYPPRLRPTVRLSAFKRLGDLSVADPAHP